ncbi:MAG TPA: alkaline phosphatase family protein [Kofleriaceae bacterium]|nr:alkaline phosphatase family protein [Kofleriaceae bacterium]
MAHRLVTIERKKVGLAPGQSFDIAFRPESTKNMSAFAELSADGYVELRLLDASDKLLASDPLSRAPIVNYQPKAIADFKARVINRSAVTQNVVLTVTYYSEKELPTVEIETAKITSVATKVFRDELKPHVTLQGKRLKITGDPSLTSLAGKWADKELDILPNVDGLEVDRNGFKLVFEDPSDGYPNGAIVLELKCVRPITLSKLIYKVRIPDPVIRIRAGLNAYGDSLHLSPVVLQLPEFQPNWVASLVEHAKSVLQDATEGLSKAVANAVAEMEANGKLRAYTQQLKQALHMQELRNFRIGASKIVLDYEPLPPEFPAPAVVTAPKPKSQRLEHLVIVMLENRSFDHMMADIVAGRNDVRLAPADYSETLKDAHGIARVYKRGKTKLNALPHDPAHDSTSQEIQAGGQFVRSFLEDHKGSPYGAEVLAYQPRENVAFFDFLAREFVMCDDWRAALLGHTWPNRQYSLAGASRKTKKGYRDNPSGSEFEFYTIPTICDVLEAQGVDWAYYKDDFAFVELYRRWVFDRTRVRTRAQFDAAIANGKLPTVTWYEPNISDFGKAVGNDDHPPISVYGAQRLLANLYAQLCKLPTPNWMLAITYDESGGFYDHLRAELAPDDVEPKQGFRVPAFLVSPWLAAGKVCPTRFDHTSLIRTILDNFCAPEPIFVSNKRVSNAKGFAKILETGSGFSVDAARSMPKFTAVIPEAVSGLEMAGALEEDRVQPQHPLFAAFENAKQDLAADIAEKRAPETPGLELAGLEGAAAPPAAPAVRFEGLYIETRPVFPELAALGWTTRPMFDDALEAIPPTEVSVDVAWDLVHDLRTRHPGVVIDPLWETRFPELEPDAADPDLQVAGTAAPQDHRWHLKAVNAEAAWKMLPGPGGKDLPGEGIVVGHLDTGYREHPDVMSMLMPAYGWDVYRNDNDPHDDMEHGFLKFPGHGTGTVSIIGSRGATSDVKGTAPAVSAIPIRISASVVHISMANMVRGIQMAVERNVHIISLSAGGLWSAALHRAVRAAVDAGVIVVAAAGNYTEIVVWPARFDEVICCGAINVKGADWRWSNGGRGEHVTVMAPGEDVWVLRPKSLTSIVVGPGSGTSFATACTAGAMATWLAYHGRDKLIEKYGRAGLPRVAKQVLRSVTHAGSAAGVLDMEKLLLAQLPAVAPAPPAPPIDPLGFAIDELQIAGTPEATIADELQFRYTVAKLSKRTTAKDAGAGGVPPIDTLGALESVAAATPELVLPMSARLAIVEKKPGGN